MKIALFGYGKMGRLVEKEAEAQGHQISVIFSRRSDAPRNLAEADLAIDFSVGSSTLDNLSLCLSHGKPMVIGTTGWENQLGKVQELVLKAQGSCLHAPNFSIGFYLYQQIVNYAAALFQPFEAYDVCGIEAHHKEKLDSPSGTAKLLTGDLLHHMPRLQNFKFSSIRCGHMPGTHTIQFDSPADTITLAHQARNREGFAQGALAAAGWLLKRKGFFSLEDMMKDILGTGKVCN